MGLGWLDYGEEINSRHTLGKRVCGAVTISWAIAEVIERELHLHGMALVLSEIVQDALCPNE